MPKKIIAIDIRLLGKKRTGDEAVFFHLTKELITLDRENEYRLLTDDRKPDNIRMLHARLECAALPHVEIVSLWALNRFDWNIWVLPKYLMQNKVDIFHTQYIAPLFVPRRTKLVLHVHDVSFRAYPDLIGWGDRMFLRLLIPRSLARADRIMVPSQFTMHEISRYYFMTLTKIVVIPNAVGDEFLFERALGDDDKRKLREKYALPDTYILAVGTLQPRKNIPFLIRTFAKLKEHLKSTHVAGSDVKLVLVGDRLAHHVDPDIDGAIEEQHIQSDVIFPGFIDQDDLPQVIRLADIFVFPSVYEGFGIPLLEAMSQQVPVVAADIPSLREVGGDAVSYFNPTDIAQCEEKLYNLFIDPHHKQELFQRGTMRLHTFSWQKSATLLRNEYNLL